MEQTEQVVLPHVEFIDDVAKFMQGRSVEVVLSNCTDSRNKYKQLEGVLVQRKARLLGKLPEIQKALDIVQVLLDKQDDKSLIIDYELAESVYAKTKVSKVRTVNLWLGADIMVEYTLEEAKELLETNLENCKTNLKTLESDLEIVRNSIIILDVTISRIWNWDVEQRKEAKEAGTSASA